MVLTLTLKLQNIVLSQRVADLSGINCIPFSEPIILFPGLQGPQIRHTLHLRPGHLGRMVILFQQKWGFRRGVWGGRFFCLRGFQEQH